MRAVPLLSVALTLLLAARATAGATCYALRPTEVGAERSYAGAPATAFDTPEGNVRVWYALDGPHAPEGAGAQPSPAAAVAAGLAAEAALERFAALGFQLPLPDGPDSPCSDAGGDARLDIYLYDFGSADGTIVVDQCVEGGTERCAGFAVVENDFVGKGYASAAEGFQTVVPHELFHLVQFAYSATSEAWWAEGTAQWAAKQVFPVLHDLEEFLPAFFQRTDRPLDFPPVGAAASFSYGAAIWPVFLTERFEAPVVRSVFEALGESASGALDAADTTLQREGSSLEAAFAEFAVWNAATGPRAGESGYASAASYPAVRLEELPVILPSKTAGALAGLSARYFHFPQGDRRHLAVSGDTARLSARFVPLVVSRARVDEVSDLPLETSAAGILVLSGRARNHRDVSFTIRIDEALGAVGGASNGGVASGGAAGASDLPLGGARAEVSQSEGGMAASESPDPAESSGGGALTAGAATAPARRRGSSGCALSPESLSRPSLATILASLGAGIGLGRLAERIWRRRAAGQDHSRRVDQDTTRRPV